MRRGGHPGGSPWVIDSEPAPLLAWPERSQGDTARLLQLLMCLALGKWGLGKQRCRSTFCCTSTEFCPESRASSFRRTSPGKSLCEAAFTKRNAWRLAPAPWLPFSSLVPPQAWTQGPWFLAAPWSTMVGTLRVGTGTSGLKPEGGWSQCRQWLSKSYIWGKPKWLEILSGQVLTQGQRQVPEKTLDRQRLTRCSRRPRPYLKVFFYEYSSWCKLSKTAISLRNSFLIVLNL